MTTILAPVDYTPVSINAANYAADLACVLGATVSLVHVYPLPVVIGDIPIPVYGPEETESFESERLDKLKSDILSRTGNGIQIFTQVIQGEILPTIRTVCNRIKPYAVVMGAETSDKLSQFFGIAPAFGAIQQLEWPLIIVPGNAKFTSIRKIGLACDFRDIPETLPFIQIKSIVNKLKAELHVIHVSTNGNDVFTPEIIDGSNSLKEMLSELRPKYQAVNTYDIAKGIEDFAEVNCLDMLIVVPKKHSLLHKLFKKSISQQLVIQSHVPIMAIHE